MSTPGVRSVDVQVSKGTLFPIGADDLTVLASAAVAPTFLVAEWPRVRTILGAAAKYKGLELVGETPVLAAPMVRLLCLMVAAHAVRAYVPTAPVAAVEDRFPVTRREAAVLLAGADGETHGSLLDWPVLGGLLYRIADELNVGGVPHAGNFHRTAAEGGAFRLLCLLLIEHVDAEA